MKKSTILSKIKPLTPESQEFIRDMEPRVRALSDELAQREIDHQFFLGTKCIGSSTIGMRLLMATSMLDTCVKFAVKMKDTGLFMTCNIAMACIQSWMGQSANISSIIKKKYGLRKASR